MDEILGLAAIVDSERRVEAEAAGVGAQQACADRVEGAAPGQARRAAQRRQAERLVQDAADPALHLGGGSTRKREPQDPRRVGPRQHQPGDPRRQGQGLARAGAGDDQERAVPQLARLDAVLDGSALRRVEAAKGRGLQALRQEGSEGGHEGQIGRRGEPLPWTVIPSSPVRRRRGRPIVRSALAVRFISPARCRRRIMSRVPRTAAALLPAPSP